MTYPPNDTILFIVTGTAASYVLALIAAIAIDYFCHRDGRDS